MPPKKKPGKELPVDGPSQSTGAPTLKTTQTTTQPPPSSEPQQTTVEVGRPEQPPNQEEVLTMNTSTQNTQHPKQPQNTKAQEDMEHDFKEEIKAIIEDELVRLR
jgi:hypothetical protein